MKKTICKILLSAALVGITGIPCFAADGWQANIHVSAGNASTKLTFGQNVAATDLNDGFYDVPALFSGELLAAFTAGNGTLWRDIRGVDNEAVKEWRLSVTSGSGETISVSWDRKALPKDSRITLVDVDTGKTLDMQVLSSYRIEKSNSCELVIEVNNL